MAGIHVRSRGAVPDLRGSDEVEVLGHPDRQALHHSGHRENVQGLFVGLRGVLEGLQGGGDDLPVLRVLRDGAGHERAACHALQGVLPDGQRGSGCACGLLRPDEPLRPVARRSGERRALREVCIPGPHLGPVPRRVLRGNLLVCLRECRQREALVRGADRAHLLLALRADGGGHELRHRALHDPKAAGLRLGSGWRRGQLGRGDCALVLLQALGADRHPAALQGACSLRDGQRFAERGVLLARQGRHVCRTPRPGGHQRGKGGGAGRGAGVSRFITHSEAW
mmetsp:Transcript_77251/g.214813  ORF Transcript_77251/g.214813 Transcript_77251/m.214813 type:complete len:282 (+) Transcript_77251:891-1736(+)